LEGTRQRGAGRLCEGAARWWPRSAAWRASRVLLRRSSDGPGEMRSFLLPVWRLPARQHSRPVFARHMLEGAALVNAAAGNSEA